MTFLILCNLGLWITYNFEIQKVAATPDQVNLMPSIDQVEHLFLIQIVVLMFGPSGGVLWVLSLDCDPENNSSTLCVLPLSLHGNNFLSGPKFEQLLIILIFTFCTWYQVVLAELWKNSYMIKAKDDHTTAIWLITSLLFVQNTVPPESAGKNGRVVECTKSG